MERRTYTIKEGITMLPSAKELFDSLEKSSKDYNIAKIREAYDFAYLAHESQLIR